MPSYVQITFSLWSLILNPVLNQSVDGLITLLQCNYIHVPGCRSTEIAWDCNDCPKHVEDFGVYLVNAVCASIRTLDTYFRHILCTEKNLSVKSYLTESSYPDGFPLHYNKVKLLWLLLWFTNIQDKFLVECSKQCCQQSTKKMDVL